MSEERLQEIKDSINLQYKVQEANDLHSFNIFTDEEQELVEEVERLNNQLDFIKDQNKYIDKLEKMIKERNSIIKEVREYIESYLPNYDFDKTNLKKLLEILDKEVK